MGTDVTEYQICVHGSVYVWICVWEPGSEDDQNSMMGEDLIPYWPLCDTQTGVRIPLYEY